MENLPRCPSSRRWVHRYSNEQRRPLRRAAEQRRRHPILLSYSRRWVRQRAATLPGAATSRRGGAGGVALWRRDEQVRRGSDDAAELDGGARTRSHRGARRWSQDTRQRRSSTAGAVSRSSTEGAGSRGPPELDGRGGVTGPRQSSTTRAGWRGPSEFEGGGGGSGATPELGHGGDAHRRWGSTAMASAVGRARRAQMGFGGGGRLGRQQQLEARGRRRSEMGTRKQGRRCGLERKREVGGHRCPYTRTYPCRWA